MAAGVVSVLLGGIVTYIGVHTMSINDLVHALTFAALGALLAGWIAARHGVLIGVAAMFAAAAIWTIDVMIRAWSSGELALRSPHCDPCGPGGYLIRMIIVTAIATPYFLPIGAAGGWIGAVGRRRLAPPR